MTNTAPPTARRRTAAGLAAAGLLLLSGCSGGGDDNGDAADKPSTTAEPSNTSTASARDAAEKEAIEVYQTYWREMEKLYADRSGKKAKLDRYAASEALSLAEADAKRAHDKKLIYIGNVNVGDPNVTKLELGGKISRATLSSCLDISDWKTVNAATRKPVSLPSKRLTKYRITAVIEKWPEGWRVVRDEPQGKSC